MSNILFYFCLIISFTYECLHESCFLFQRLEEIMRRTRRTDSSDTVRFSVQFSKSTMPQGSYDAQSASSSKSAPILKATQPILYWIGFNTEISTSEDLAKWSPTKGKHRACAQRQHRKWHQGASGDKVLTAEAEQWGGHGTYCGLQRTQVS